MCCCLLIRDEVASSTRLHECQTLTVDSFFLYLWYWVIANRINCVKIRRRYYVTGFIHLDSRNQSAEAACGKKHIIMKLEEEELRNHFQQQRSSEAPEFWALKPVVLLIGLFFQAWHNTAMVTQETNKSWATLMRQDSCLLTVFTFIYLFIYRARGTTWTHVENKVEATSQWIFALRKDSVKTVKRGTECFLCGFSFHFLVHI